MSKAVMLSVRPKWCEKIASGEKSKSEKLSRIWKHRLSATSTGQLVGLGGGTPGDGADCDERIRWRGKRR